MTSTKVGGGEREDQICVADIFVREERKVGMNGSSDDLLRVREVVIYRYRLEGSGIVNGRWHQTLDLGP